MQMGNTNHKYEFPMMDPLIHLFQIMLQILLYKHVGIFLTWGLVDLCTNQNT